MPTRASRGAQIQFRAVGAEAWQPLQTQVSRRASARARVNSSAVPAGEYEFKAIVEDMAGNQSETTLREDGIADAAHLPASEPSRAAHGVGRRRGVSQTVPYGTSSMVRGRLLDARGEPIAEPGGRPSWIISTAALTIPRVERVATYGRRRTILERQSLPVPHDRSRPRSRAPIATSPQTTRSASSRSEEQRALDRHTRPDQRGKRDHLHAAGCATVAHGSRLVGSWSRSSTG